MKGCSVRDEGKGTVDQSTNERAEEDVVDEEEEEEEVEDEEEDEDESECEEGNIEGCDDCDDNLGEPRSIV